MKRERGFALPALLIPYLWKAAAVAVVLALLAGLVWLRDEKIRAEAIKPWQVKVQQLEDTIDEATEKAKIETAARQKQENESAENWRQYVLSEQANWEARERAAAGANRGGVFVDPGRGGGCGQAGEAKAGTEPVPADRAAGSRLSDQAREFLQAEALRADRAAIYAQGARAEALACIAELNR